MLYTVASALYNIKLLYNSTVSMVTDAIGDYYPVVYQNTEHVSVKCSCSGCVCVLM